MRPNRSQLATLTTPSRFWTAPSYRQHRLPPTGSVNSTPSPQRFHRKCATALPQRKLGNGVCELLKPPAENLTTFAGRRSAPKGNALWAMESLRGVSLCACAEESDPVQPHRGSVAKHPGCCSLLAGRRLGAVPSHRFPEAVGERGTSSCLPSCPAAPVAGERKHLGMGWREDTACLLGPELSW